MTVKMAPKRRRPKRIAKRIEQRHGARTFEGAEAIGKAQRWEKAMRTCRGIVYMCRAAAALINGDIAAQVIYAEAGYESMGGSSRTADSLGRFELMGHRRPARQLAAMRKVGFQRASMRSEKARTA